MTRKGFLLADVWAAGVIFIIMAAGIFSVLTLYRSMSERSAHKITAINHARAVAERIIDIASANPAAFPSSLSVNKVHTKVTDPDICTLPDSDFKNVYNGGVSYTITAKTYDWTVHMLIVDVAVTWTDRTSELKTETDHIIFALCKPWGQ